MCKAQAKKLDVATGAHKIPPNHHSSDDAGAWCRPDKQARALAAPARATNLPPTERRTDTHHNFIRTRNAIPPQAAHLTSSRTTLSNAIELLKSQNDSVFLDRLDLVVGCFISNSFFSEGVARLV